jgi:hypothetical protein
VFDYSSHFFAMRAAALIITTFAAMTAAAATARQASCEPQRCGGLAGFACPKGQKCFDDPRDSCSPDKGVDCIGICLTVSRIQPLA